MNYYKIPGTMAALLLCMLICLTIVPGSGMYLHEKIDTNTITRAFPSPVSLLYAADPRKPSGETTAALIKDDGSRSALHQVMWTILIIWAGISLYLFILDRKISRLEKEQNER